MSQHVSIEVIFQVRNGIEILFKFKKKKREANVEELSGLAMTTQDVSTYDVFLVHSSEDEKIAHDIDVALIENGLKTYAHYRSEEDGFSVGKFVTDNIRHAVQNSRLVLILVTSNAVTSRWVTFEIVLSIEKSFVEDSMCVRLVFQGMSDEEIKQFKTGDIEYIPYYVLDFDNEAWKTDLVEKINGKSYKSKSLSCDNHIHDTPEL